MAAWKDRQFLYNSLLINNLNSFNMLALFIIATWTLSFVMAITKIENLGIDRVWKGVVFFIFAPVINLVVFLGWGAVGYMKDDWENLM